MKVKAVVKVKWRDFQIFKLKFPNVYTYDQKAYEFATFGKCQREVQQKLGLAAVASVLLVSHCALISLISQNDAALPQANWIKLAQSDVNIQYVNRDRPLFFTA